MSEEARSISTEEVVALVEYIAKSLVDEPDAVKVTIREGGREQAAETGLQADDDGDQYGQESGSRGEDEPDDQITIELTVAKDDMGKVIGKQGRIAKAIRTVVRAAAVKSDVRYRIDIM